MRIKWGATASDGRGKIGGMVAENYKGTGYLRANGTQKQRPSAGTQRQRARYRKILNLWHDLTPAEREQWSRKTLPRRQSYKNLGTVDLTDFQYFLRLNLNLIIVGGILRRTPIESTINHVIVIDYGMNSTLSELKFWVLGASPVKYPSSKLRAVLLRDNQPRKMKQKMTLKEPTNIAMQPVHPNIKCTFAVKKHSFGRVVQPGQKVMWSLTFVHDSGLEETLVPPTINTE